MDRWWFMMHEEEWIINANVNVSIDWFVNENKRTVHIYLNKHSTTITRNTKTTCYNTSRISLRTDTWKIIKNIYQVLKSLQVGKLNLYKDTKLLIHDMTYITHTCTLHTTPILYIQYKFVTGSFSVKAFGSAMTILFTLYWISFLPVLKCSQLRDVVAFFQHPARHCGLWNAVTNPFLQWILYALSLWLDYYQKVHYL